MPTCLHPAGVLLDSRVSAVPDILMALSAPSTGSIVCRRGVAVMDLSERSLRNAPIGGMYLHACSMVLSWLSD